MINITRLFERYYNKTASASERKELMEKIAGDAYSKELLLLEKNAWEQLDFDGNVYSIAESDHMFGQILEKGAIADSSTVDFRSAADSLPPTDPDHVKPLVQSIHFLKTAWFRYAAILLLLAGTATYLYFSTLFKRNPALTKTNQTQKTQNILPGGNKAILTLSDGSTIVLDSVANGSLAQQGNTKIVKQREGSLAYQAGNATGPVLYNTISTPKGGLYQVTLPDRSKVWLNAASSITFPTAFAKERNVTITGEVYIEVAPDRHKPFYMQAGAERIEVLGTSFNVNAYSNESGIKTTLLEGSIKLGSTILKPGETYMKGKHFSTDIQKVIAWKNGLFNFQHATLREVMRQLERWYDIEVVIPANMPETYFGGEMSRDLTLADVLKALKVSGIHFTMDDRKLLVKP